MDWQHVSKETFSCQEYWAMTMACFAHCGSCLQRQWLWWCYLFDRVISPIQPDPAHIYIYTAEVNIVKEIRKKGILSWKKKTLNKMRNLSAGVLSETWDDRLFRFFFIFFCSKRLFFHQYNSPISLQNIPPRHPEPHSFPHFIFSPWSCQSQH